MVCVRRSGRDRDDRIDASSEIFASPPGYHAETKDGAIATVPAATHQYRQEYSSTSPVQEHTGHQGNFYSTGYETGYYNNTTSGADTYYQQQQQGGYDQYNNYGYHPSAVYMPNIANGHEQQQQQYQGYDNNQYYANSQQPYPPQPVYYNSGPPMPQQPQHEPPHSPTNPTNH